MLLIVITDTDQDIACTIDTDAMLATGPVVPAAEYGAQLAEWVNTLDYSYEGADSGLLRSLFGQWLAQRGLLPETPPESIPEPATDDGVPGPDAEAALAEHEAQNAADGVPPPQPADTDPTATDGPTPAGQSSDTENGIPEGERGNAGALTNGEPISTAGETSPDKEPITVTRTVDCPNCGGAGTLTFDGANGPETNPCGMCQNTGKVTVNA